jgi:hypothetical protein
MPKMGAIRSNQAIICFVNGIVTMNLALLTPTVRTRLGRSYGAYTLYLGTKFLFGELYKGRSLLEASLVKEVSYVTSCALDVYLKKKP